MMANQPQAFGQRPLILVAIAGLRGIRSAQHHGRPERRRGQDERRQQQQVVGVDATAHDARQPAAHDRPEQAAEADDREQPFGLGDRVEFADH